ncbi:LptA/OstA family protein [Sphingomonas bacterium]|uniref:LptA/OstA family protein n=1 Tax=Sphingomonas bacterium TaxID=1895847 RepID=UPI00261DBB10|nr:LptA/OstA family protein [Sphingomonas bacterium]MDB5679869.1 OstA family protein [Sphingomonas bacterium]
MRIVTPLIALVAFAAAGAAIADSRHDSSAPIDFAADHAELQDQANRSILSGNVRITQAEMVLTAARVTIAYTGKVAGGSAKVSRIDASGGVTVTRPDQKARGQYGVYDVNRRTIIMLGGVTLNQGANTVSGSRLTINLDTGKAVIDGSGSVSSPAGAPSTTTGGRVTGRFSVPKRN